MADEVSTPQPISVAVVPFCTKVILQELVVADEVSTPQPISVAVVPF